MAKQVKRRASIHRIVEGLALVAIVFLVYGSALRGGFVWDDDALTQNPLLRSARGLSLIWTQPQANIYEAHYWPLVYSTFWLNARAWGFEPFWYHFQNVALHGLNVLLLYLVLRRLAVRGAWLGAALFAVHPVHVESVAWISELKDVLCGLFYLASALLFFRFHERRRDNGGQSDPPGATWEWLCYSLAVLLFVCAMLSKSVAVSLPLALLICLWWRHGGLVVRDGLMVLPFFVVGITLAAVDVWVTRTTESSAIGLALGERIQVAGRALWFYLAKLAWPAELMTIYPRWETDRRSASLYAYPLSMAGALTVCWLMRRRWGRAPCAALLFFCVTLGPMLGLIDYWYMSHAYVADRFQYLASIGPIVLFAAGVVTVARRRARLSGPLGVACVAFLLATLGWRTWQQSLLYEGPERLFQHNVDHNPRAWMAHINLGTALDARGAVEESLEHLRLAAEINPRSHKAQNNIGAALSKLGQEERALPHYRRALELNPGFVMARHNLGTALGSLKRYDEEVEQYRQVLEISPHFVPTLSNLGNALLVLGKSEEAVRVFRQALAIDPQLVSAHLRLGEIHHAKGDLELSLKHFTQAARLRPADPAIRYNIGAVHAGAGRFALALEHLHRSRDLAEATGDHESARRISALIEKLKLEL